MKLLKLNKKEKELYHTMANVLHAFGIQNIYRRFNTFQLTVQDNKYYASIPSSGSIIEHLMIIKKSLKIESPRLLDIGAGGGFVLNLARHLKFNVEGIEYQKKDNFTNYLYYIKYNTNAFKVKKYNTYDVIYMYQPIADTKLLIKLYKHVVKHMVKGQILLLAGTIPTKFLLDCKDKIQILPTSTDFNFCATFLIK
jgi:2-polyprenyl-3-methyl-5-hydroxy-6-metoxy-1,4-benzoquinol methylase